MTCYFCHSVDAVNGTHNDPLHLANDNVMRGGIADPLANTAHASMATPLTDQSQFPSATLCGSCHDIVTTGGAAIERTFSEWQASAYGTAPAGEPCGVCHMEQSDSLVPVAAVTGAPARRYHGHAHARPIDAALVAGFPQATEQQQAIQDFLATSLQDAVCVVQEGASSQIQVILDNVAAGHGWPSGSTQDRRAWIEVEAYAGSTLLYASGAVLDGGTPTELGTADPDLWLLRDCMFDTTGTQVAMFERLRKTRDRSSNPLARRAPPLSAEAAQDENELGVSRSGEAVEDADVRPDAVARDAKDPVGDFTTVGGHGRVEAVEGERGDGEAARRGAEALDLRLDPWAAVLRRRGEGEVVRRGPRPA